MGACINPPNGESKEEWLEKNADLIHITDPEQMMREASIYSLIVCLMDNGNCTAAGICFDREEVLAFAEPDGRPKTWYYAPVESLYEVSPELEEYMGKAHG